MHAWQAYQGITFSLQLCAPAALVERLSAKGLQQDKVWSTILRCCVQVAPTKHCGVTFGHSCDFVGARKT